MTLSPESRCIIEAARPGEELAEVDRDRIKARLFGRLATGAVVVGAVAGTAAKAAAATEAATGASKAAGAAAGGGLLSLFGAAGTAATLAKLGLALVLVGGIGVGARQLLEHDAPATVAPTATAAPPREQAEPAAAAVEGAAARPPEQPKDEAEPEPKRAEASGREPAREPKPAASSLAAETTLLQQAQNELQSGNPQRALELLERHGNEHGAGALREERQAARVLALCNAGRAAEARAEAERFAAEFPRSPHRGRVLGACAEAAGAATP